MKSLKECINEMYTTEGILSDIDQNLDFDLEKELISMILNSKSKDEFKEYCNTLASLLVPEKSIETSDIYCTISSLSYKHNCSAFLSLGKAGKKMFYRIFFAFNKINIERMRYDLKTSNHNICDAYGYLPKKIDAKFWK